jgi:hypothetical protein
MARIDKTIGTSTTYGKGKLLNDVIKPREERISDND